MMLSAINAATFGKDSTVQFALSPSRIAGTVCGEDNLVVVGNRLAIVASIALTSAVRRFADRDGTMREGKLVLHRLKTPEILARHDLEIVRVETQSCTVVSTFDHGAFAKAAIARQTFVLEEFLKLLVTHCANRSVGDKKLSTVTSIQLRLAEVAQVLALVGEMMNQADDCTATIYSEVTSLISKSADLLVKAAGARSMLAGGLVEMQFIFTLFNSIYLCGANDQY